MIMKKKAPRPETKTPPPSQHDIITGAGPKLSCQIVNVSVSVCRRGAIGFAYILDSSFITCGVGQRGSVERTRALLVIVLFIKVA